MDSVEEYYTKEYGNPDRQADFSTPEGKKLSIFKWNAHTTSESVTMYATIGARVVGNAMTEPTKACEFFIGLSPEEDDIVKALAEIALTGNGTGKIPNAGDTVTFSYPLWSGAEVTSLLFTDGDDIIKPVKIGKKDYSFIQLVPVFASELKFKKEAGEEGLWKEFQAKGIAYWSTEREAAF